MDSRTLAERFHRARRDPGRVVLEGFHAIKHALRFGADLRQVVASEPSLIGDLCGELAPDIADVLFGRLREVPAATLEELVPRVPRTGIVAIAERPDISAANTLAAAASAPLVLLEEPRNQGNIGAVVRVAAAAGAAGVLTLGGGDPWHPSALRGAAGLHFALPVVRLEAPPATDRPLVAIDPGGEPLGSVTLPPGALIAFGSERVGLSAELMARADQWLSIPMREGISSLNLATAVAVVLYGLG